jgi:hypothetical protein
MKIKVAIASLAVVAIAVVAFSFTTKESNRKVLSKTFYYVNGTDDQRLETGFSNQSEPRQNTISALNYKDMSNWSETPNSATAYTSSDGSSYVLSITIPDYEAAQDGDDDHMINLQEALDAVFTQFSVAGIYPTNVNVDVNSNGQSASVTSITKAESIF